MTSTEMNSNSADPTYGKRIDTIGIFLDDDQAPSITNIIKQSVEVSTSFRVSASELIQIIKIHQHKSVHRFAVDSIYMFDADADIHEINANDIELLSKFTPIVGFRDIDFTPVQNGIPEYNSVIIVFKPDIRDPAYRVPHAHTQTKKVIYNV